ncbi:hypothetical protein LB505_003796 [Fusarium chuoi]|nr:hypothetical protein LB505_003796 [Fusarium chuoi]
MCNYIYQYWPDSMLSTDGQLLMHQLVLISSLAACRERQQPSNHPWAKLIQRPESRLSYSPQVRAQ